MVRPAVKLIVLSRYADLFTGFRANVEMWEPELKKILVRDGDQIEPFYAQNWSVIDGVQPFSYARNLNRGLQLYRCCDIIVCGDDVRFESKFVEALQRTAYSDPAIGISTAQLHGQSPFVIGYIKRKVLNDVGYLDEQFDGYGMEDNDWFHRMALMGYRTQPTDEVKCVHTGGTSFFRRAAEGGEDVQTSNDRMRARFDKKWSKGEGK